MRDSTPTVVLVLILTTLWAVPSVAQAQSREEKVRADKARVEAEGFWRYNDLQGAREEARRTGKPLLVNLRCVPCEECVKLDDDLIDQDPVVRPLLEKFVCVRVVGTNGLDLSLFQFDTDQSFALFFMNADDTIYGRFGTRSHRTEWVGDVSLAGLGRALEGALELHAGYPANKNSLAGKKGEPLEAARPELFPSLQDKYTGQLDYAGNVVKSCIHCHQIGDARRDYYRSRGEPLPETLMFSYPHPKTVGLILDPKERALVVDVTQGSAAARAGFKKGDRIRTLTGQPLLSTADVQWVLHRASPGGARLIAEIERAGQSKELTLALDDGWRRAEDVSWRASSWGLRRMTTGGLVLEPATAEVRQKHRLSAEAMALNVKFVGQYNAHAAAKNAGFQKDDVLLSFDGQTNLQTEGALFQYAMTATKPGQKIDVVIIRGGERKTLQLPMQP